MSRHRRRGDWTDAIPRSSSTATSTAQPSEAGNEAPEQTGSYWEQFKEEDFYYNMKHKSRGVAIIINIESFDPKLGPGFDERKGSKVDVDELQKTLKVLDFKDIRVYQESSKLTRAAISILFKEVAKEDFTDRDCLFVAIFSHGKDSGQISAYDTSMSYDEVFDPIKFIPSLAGKPKLFIMQACRGEKLDPGMEFDADGGNSKSKSRKYVISKESDILVAYSTVEGYAAWRNEHNGSWFIQSFCEMTNKYGKELEVCQLLARVNHMVSHHYKSSVRDPNKDNKKQSPCVTSTLTKSLLFK